MVFILAFLQLSASGTDLPSYRQAYQRAMQLQRPLVVVVGADWCVHCQVLKHETIPELARTGGFKGIEATYVDLNRQRRLAERLMIGSRVPQLVRYERQGDSWRVTRLQGAHHIQTVKLFLQGQEF